MEDHFYVAIPATENTSLVINKTIVVMSTIADAKVAHNYNCYNGISSDAYKQTAPLVRGVQQYVT